MILVILLMSVLLFLENLHIVYHALYGLSTGNVPVICTNSDGAMAEKGSGSDKKTDMP